MLVYLLQSKYSAIMLLAVALVAFVLAESLSYANQHLDGGQGRSRSNADELLDWHHEFIDRLQATMRGRRGFVGGKDVANGDPRSRMNDETIDSDYDSYRVNEFDLLYAEDAIRRSSHHSEGHHKQSRRFESENELTVYIFNRTEEFSILSKFYTSTGGPNWNVNAGWLSDANFSEWFGLSTNDAGSVIEIFSFENNQFGMCPAFQSEAFNVWIALASNIVSLSCLLVLCKQYFCTPIYVLQAPFRPK